MAQIVDNSYGIVKIWKYDYNYDITIATIAIAMTISM